MSFIIDVGVGGGIIPDELPSEESELPPVDDPETGARFFFGFFSGFSSSPFSSDLPDRTPVLGMMFERERETKARRSLRLLSASRFFSNNSNDFKFSCNRSTNVAC